VWELTSAGSILILSLRVPLPLGIDGAEKPKPESHSGLEMDTNRRLHI